MCTLLHVHCLFLVSHSTRAIISLIFWRISSCISLHIFLRTQKELRREMHGSKNTKYVELRRLWHSTQIKKHLNGSTNTKILWKFQVSTRKVKWCDDVYLVCLLCFVRKPNCNRINFLQICLFAGRSTLQSEFGLECFGSRFLLCDSKHMEKFHLKRLILRIEWYFWWFGRIVTCEYNKGRSSDAMWEKILFLNMMFEIEDV